MYNGAIHDTLITPRTQSLGKFPFDKKADLDELSQQMKVNIAQLKSLLRIKAKDEDCDLRSIGDFTHFGRCLNRELDQRENELKLLQDDIEKLYLKRHPSPRRIDRDAVSLPSTPRTSFMLEGPLPLSIPSKSSAFSPRFSTSSLSGKDHGLREFEEDMASFRRYSRENDDRSIRSAERSNGYSLPRQKSSSSLASSTKMSPRNPSNRESRSSSSNYKRMPKTERTENSSNSSQRNQKTRESISSVRSSSSMNKSQASHSKAKMDSRVSNPSSSISNSRSKKPRRTATKEKSRTKKSRYYPDCEDARSTSGSGEQQVEYESSSSEDEREKSVGRESRKTKKKSSSSLFKFEAVEKKLLQLQQRCDMLEQENEDIKKDQQTKNHRKIADLKHRNSELVNVARRLEQKAKTLHMENNKRMSEVTHSAQDFEEQKKNFANIAAKMENEHKKEVSGKDREIKTLKHQMDDLKKAFREAKRAQISKDGNDTTAAALKQSQKESLQLQKLAMAGNKKVTIRSLSMPVTARQKILEEANRNLRRQLSQLEENYRQACNGASNEDLTSELESMKAKCEGLEKVEKDAKIQTVNLESQLQIAKVEASDTNIKLNELQKSFDQLQNEYCTVHEQLSVAIKERDAAITQCKDNATKMNQMELCIKNMQNHTGGGDELDRTQYQISLEKLQAKVLELEKQCQEQNETNRLLNSQLINLMKGSSSASEKECAKGSEAESSARQKDTPVTTQLDNTDQGRNAPIINANLVRGSPVQYQVKERGQLQGDNGQANVAGNEDTEVEDFIEEELTQAMDHNDAGKLRVYIAKYTYNPYEGPNDLPEAELPLVAGDYVYVYGPMDEDGFFKGELMNGRRGLVPSNFLEAVHDDGHGYGTKSILKMDSSVSKGTSSEMSNSESLLSSCTSLGSSRISQRGDAFGPDQSVLIHGVLPYPRRLRVDKQLSHSLIIGWLHPQLSEGESVEEYHIFVDGEFKTAVNGKKQKAVVENIKHDQPNRISVCAVSQWGISDENLCVLTHGRGADMAPTSVRMEKVGASSARVAWTPSCQQCHVVSVEEEGMERWSSPRLKNPTHMTHTVSPPAYRLTFGNLRPNFRYKVTVNAMGSPDGPLSFARFTTPESGPPDPPLGVQVEECQNANYFLITWFPVTLNTLGTSNGVIVKGYSIHIADTKICEVDSPTMDQCTIKAQTLAGAFKDQLSMGPKTSLYRLSKPSGPNLRWNKHVPPSITIKTRAVNGQESDYSDPCIISQELFTKLVDLVKDTLIMSSPKPAANRIRMRPPLLHSVESTDIDVSFSSDISIPGINSTRPGIGKKDGRNGANSSDSGRSRLSKTRLLEQTRIVPSIEITQDTSSDEDPGLHNGLGSRSSSNRSLGNRHSKPNDATNIASTSKTISNENPKTSYKNFDNDDVVSVSSSHTSSSNGGDILKRTKPGSIAHRAAKVIHQHKLQRGESAEYSNPEDHILPSSNRARKNVNISGSNSNRPTASEHSSDQVRKHQHKHHHHIRGTTRRPHSVASDHSQGSHRSHSSSQPGHPRLHQGRHNGRRDITRQSTLSSQSGSGFASEIDSTYPIDIDKNRVSLFVALYSYDPHMMSPNTDTYDEELAFTEGQLIKVFGTKDDDGFYYGETHNGPRGHVPCNMVSEVEVESMQMLLDLHARGHLPSASPDEDEQSTSEAKTKSGASQVPNGVQQTDGSTNGSKRRYFSALFDYDPRHLSPNIDVDVEINFSRGDVITTFGDMDDDGFYKGKVGDKEGLVPSNFLEEISEQEMDDLRKKFEKSKKDVGEELVTSLDPKLRLNQNSVHETSISEPSSIYTGQSSTVNPSRVDNAGSAVSRKKGGLMSKGKKLFKKLGGSQDGKRR